VGGVVENELPVIESPQREGRKSVEGSDPFSEKEPPNTKK
jgi:hypothetical protein